MNNRNFFYVYLAIAFLLGCVIGGVVIWTAQSGQVAQTQENIKRLEERIAELEKTSLVVEETTEPVQQAEITTEPVEPEEPAGDSEESATEPQIERQFCYVRAVDITPVSYFLTVDYALFLTGQEAADAAAAHGDESPPPNDYYIVNDNPKLRQFEVDSNRLKKVKLYTYAEGVDTDGYEIDFTQWAQMYRGTLMNGQFVKDLPYWITIENGKIVALEEQYLP